MSGGERLWVHPEAAQETRNPRGGQGGTAIRGTEAEDSHSSGSCPQPQVIVMLLHHMVLGAQLSGGPKHRIAIARALVRNPR